MKVQNQSNECNNSDKLLLQVNRPVQQEKIRKWNQEENLKYIIFLDYHKGSLDSKYKRRSYGLFVQMAKFITTRTPSQCRSHHQKLEQKFTNFRKIVSSFKRQIGKKVYKLKYHQIVSNSKHLLGHFSNTIHQQELTQCSVQTDLTIGIHQILSIQSFPRFPQNIQEISFPIFWRFQ